MPILSLTTRSQKTICALLTCCFTISSCGYHPNGLSPPNSQPPEIKNGETLAIRTPDNHESVTISWESGTLLVMVFYEKKILSSVEHRNGRLHDSLLQVEDDKGTQWKIVDLNGDGIPDFRSKGTAGSKEKYLPGKFVK